MSFTLINSVVICSGGIDSTTVLYGALSRNENVSVIGFNYGQKAQIELECLKDICMAKSVPCKIVDLSDIGKVLFSALTNSGLKVPTVEDQSGKKDSLGSTVVPNRNAIFIMIASWLCKKY